MLSAIYLIIGAVDFAVLLWALRLNMQYSSVALKLAALPATLLWYDNVIVGLGSTIGEGDLLMGLNTVRFLGHYILLPVAILVIPAMAREAGFGWGRSNWVLAAFCALAAYFIGHDLWLFYNATFYPSCFADVLRYTTHISEFTACGPDAVIGSGAKVPPIPAITFGVSTMVFGAYLWWKIGYKWLFLIMLISQPFFGAPFGSTGGVFSNIGEPISCAALLLAAVHIIKNKESWQQNVVGEKA